MYVSGSVSLGRAELSATTAHNLTLPVKSLSHTLKCAGPFPPPADRYTLSNKKMVVWFYFIERN